MEWSDRDWTWAGRYASELTSDFGTWDEQRKLCSWPIPFTVERVSLIGDSKPREVLIEYRTQRGSFGYRMAFDDNDLGQPDDDAYLVLMNISEGTGQSEATWSDGERTWWTDDEAPPL
jgi:hypothetical protein